MTARFPKLIYTPPGAADHATAGRAQPTAMTANLTVDWAWDEASGKYIRFRR